MVVSAGIYFGKTLIPVGILITYSKGAFMTVFFAAIVLVFSGGFLPLFFRSSSTTNRKRTAKRAISIWFIPRWAPCSFSRPSESCMHTPAALVSRRRPHCPKRPKYWYSFRPLSALTPRPVFCRFTSGCPTPTRPLPAIFPLSCAALLPLGALPATGDPRTCPDRRRCICQGQNTRR